MTKETNGYHYDSFDETEEFDEHDDNSYLTDELDHTILMHRDAHFGGNFQTMIDYYDQEGIGVLPELDIERIQYLAEVELELQQDLSNVLLSAPEKEKIAAVKKAYLDLR